MMSWPLRRTTPSKRSDVLGQQAHQGGGQAGLAGARLPDHTDGHAPFRDRERDAVDGADDALAGGVVQMQIVDLEQGHCCSAW